MAFNMLKSLIPSSAAGDIQMNDLESGSSRTAVNSRGQPHAPAHMDVGPDSQQQHSAAPTGQPPAPHFTRPALPLAPVQLVPPQPVPPQLVPPQPVPPQPVPPQLVPPQLVPPQLVPPQLVPPQLVPPQLVPPQLVPPQLVPPQPVPPQLVPPQLVPPQPVLPQPNPNYHTPTTQPVPIAPIPPHVVQPPHNIAPQPTSQGQSGVTAPLIPPQQNASQPQPFRFNLQNPPLPYVFGSAANHQGMNTSDTAPHLGKRNRPVDEDPKKIRVIRHPSPQLLNEIRGTLSQTLEVQQNKRVENLESRIQIEFNRRQEQIDAQMVDKERSLEEAQKKVQLLLNENAEAEARRRAEDEAQRRERDQEQAERLAEALARADKAEATLRDMESKMEKMMNAILAGAPHSSTVSGHMHHTQSTGQEGGSLNPRNLGSAPMNSYAETSSNIGPSAAPTASFSALGGDPNLTTSGHSVEETINPVRGGDTNPAAMDLYIDSAGSNGAPNRPIVNVGQSAHASGIEETPAFRGRKGKHPIRRREDAYDGDEDEDGSDDSDNSGEDDDMGKVASALHEDHQPNIDPGVQTVPPPRKHTAPRGGGGSNQIAMPASHTEPQPAPTSRRIRTRTANWANGLAGVYGEAEQDTTPRNRTKKMARAFRKTTLKGFNPVKASKDVSHILHTGVEALELTSLQTGVRRAMQELMGVEKDQDIINRYYATTAEVDNYAHGGGNDPGLDPMRPYFEVGGYNSWNDRLCEKFVDYYEERVEAKLSAEDRAAVENHFLGRLYRLGRKWRKARTKTELERIEEEKRSLKASRATTRRLTLYDDRREICAGNILNPDGSVNMAWTFLSNMLDKLGAVGMSSDESEQENGRTVYIVKKREWRSEDITQLLMYIDKDRNTTNATGGARPGNPPRKRKRFVANPRASKRDPSLGCPLNYYNQVFYANLTNRQSYTQIAPEIFMVVMFVFEI
ncbi:hypothetical protein HYPSUDRAFT_59396 [Hypholoma sublateritium FD-334 SS-4]|uniref:Uncharacterized protein n=1 Tax=Hypholoma sublateritium (strain FD-334 SS-4) TaxID=945553 RepID=A0A0D2P164_HYPSF|nr:hypothetical protein HYPSUDRAFT_59396 [Hypholoma sublateritium FD-334 SS-4]